jgi:hypothetical protein
MRRRRPKRPRTHAGPSNELVALVAADAADRAAGEPKERPPMSDDAPVLKRDSRCPNADGYVIRKVYNGSRLSEWTEGGHFIGQIETLPDGRPPVYRRLCACECISFRAATA